MDKLDTGSEKFFYKVMIVDNYKIIDNYEVLKIWSIELKKYAKKKNAIFKIPSSIFFTLVIQKSDL